MSETRTPIDILKAARKRIEDPKNWCQGHAYGKYVDKVPTAWCAMGAVWQEIGELSTGATSIECEGLLSHFTGGESVVHFNDCHKHEEVLALFDKAIGE